jgi:hypothetical protein
MINYAFQFVEAAYFVVGRNNLRSKKAMSKIGGIKVTDLDFSPVMMDVKKEVVYQIKKSEWTLLT